MSRRRKFAYQGISPVPPVATLSPLHVEGIRLVRSDGSTFAGIAPTAFRAFQWWLESKRATSTKWAIELSAFASWTRATQVAAIRSLGMYWAEPGQGIGKFDPRQYANLWPELRNFGRWCNSHGLILHFTCGADHQTEQLRTIDLEDFYRRAVQALDGLAAVVDWANEAPKNGAGVPMFDMPAAQTLVQSKGSNLGDQLPPVPVWTKGASCFHPNRDDFVRKGGKSGLDLRNGETTEGIAIPGVILYDENIGLGEVDEPGRTSANPWAMWQFTAWCVMAGIGYANAHIRSAINGLDVPGPRADQCVRAMVDAAKRIPQTFALGEYQRGNSPGEPQNPNLPFLHFDSEQPNPPTNGAKRSYCLWNGSEGLFIVIEPLPGWTPEQMLKPGFSIIESWGYDLHIDTVYRVRR